MHIWARWLWLVGGSLFPVIGWGQGGSSLPEATDPFSEEERLSPVLMDPAPSRYRLDPLQAYADPFASLSEFSFSFLRYRPRGYDFRQQGISLNDIDLSNEFSGGKPWGLLRLIYDTPYEALHGEGLVGDPAMPGIWGGSRAYLLEAGSLPLGGRVGWIFSDHRFRQGVRVNANSGWSRHGWAGALSASRRWGRDAYVKGVFADDVAGSLSLDKRWGERHTLSVHALFSSTQQGVRGATTAEAFALTEDPLYNPYWGEQAGAIRNARVRNNRYMMGLATWRFVPSDQWNLQVSAALLHELSGYSGLDRYGASNPYPDYYRYMPSYLANPTVATSVQEAWEAGNRQITQIDWDRLYEINRTAADGAAVYALGSDRTDQLSFQLAARFEARSRFGVKWQGGVRVRVERQGNYRRLEDLLGAAYVRDIDQFLIDDEYFGDQLQNDLNHPNRSVEPGEAYAYNYDLYHRYYGGWVRLETDGPSGGFGNSRLKGAFTLQTAWRSYDRLGFYEKELFPGSASFGPSPQATFTEYRLQGSLSYAFSAAHHLGLEVAYGDQAPVAQDLFLSVEDQNRLLEDPHPENWLGGELRYRWRGRWWDVSLTGYVTRRQGGVEVRSYYDDIEGAYANAVLRGLDRLHVGAELGVLFTLTPRWSLRLVGAWTRSQYAQDAWLDIYDDKSGEAIVEAERTYLKGYYIGGSPQQVASGELRYGGRMWMASLSVNWTGDHYVMLNPVRRTHWVCDKVWAPEIRAAFLEQERLGNATTLDLFVSKSFRIGQRGYLSLSVSVQNLANRRTIIYSGYEPWRIARSGSGIDRTFTPFDSRYLHAYGRTFYGTVNYRF